MNNNIPLYLSLTVSTLLLLLTIGLLAWDYAMMLIKLPRVRKTACGEHHYKVHTNILHREDGPAYINIIDNNIFYCIEGKNILRTITSRG